MKKVFIFLFALVAFTACKKDINDPQPNDPQPNEPVETPAGIVAGTYKLTSFHFIQGANEIEMPTLPLVESGKTVASGTAKMAKKSDGKVVLDLNLFIEGEGTVALIEKLEVEVRKSGSNYGLYAGGDRIGDADGGFIIFNVSGTDSSTGDELKLAFHAKK
ncbi:hypothetical protein ACFQ4C_10825 [Larkinella insperata]|uniref:Lipocalin-like domain-containing protein n=1 Tax=Larkinella insperata TaxID=332158 RepID=A0ABW3Q943_9BACT|nr:hypothetical protein [Larkinella insperata]